MRRLEGTEMWLQKGNKKKPGVLTDKTGGEVGGGCITYTGDETTQD